MSGLSRTPGKRVRVNSPPRVRIPPSPPFKLPYFLASSDLNQPATVSDTESYPDIIVEHPVINRLIQKMTDMDLIVLNMVAL